MGKQVSKKTVNPSTSRPSKTSWLEGILNGTKYSKKQFGFYFFCLSFLLYMNTIGNDFSMDDSFVTRSHPYVTKGFDGIKDILTNPYLNDQKLKGEFRPVAQITFAIEYQFFGENPHVNHFFNVLFFGLICVLIYKLFTSIFEDKYHPYIFVGLLIFIVHPVHTEVIANIKNRENLLGSLFGLLSLLQAVKHLNSGKIKYFFFSAIYLLIAILSKSDSIVFTGFIILIAIYFKKYKSILPYFVILIIVFEAFNFYKHYITPGMSRNTEFHETPLIGEAKNFINTIKLSLITLWYYLKLTILPYPLRFYYGTGLINIPTWANPLIWISLVSHLVLLFFGIRGTIRRTFTGFTIMWYLAGLFIFSQLVEPVIGIVAERHLFISSIGSSMLIGFGLVKLYDFLKEKHTEYLSTFFAAVASILIVFSILTIHRNKIWQDAVTLYKTDAKHLQESIFFHVEMGNNYTRETGNDPNDPKYVRNLNASIQEYKIVLKAMPKHTQTLYNMGMSYLRVGKPIDANKKFLEAAATDSNYRAVNHLIGLTYLFLQDTTNAIIYFKKELYIKPNNSNSVDLLYGIYSKRKDFKEGVAVFEPIIEKGIINTRLLKSLANCYYFSGNIDKAMYYRKRSESKDYVENEDNMW